MRGMEEEKFTLCYFGVLLCCVNVCIQAEMYTYFSKQNRLLRVLLAYIRRLLVVVVVYICCRLLPKEFIIEVFILLAITYAFHKFASFEVYRVK